jgi:hypothetical protein
MWNIPLGIYERGVFINHFAIFQKGNANFSNPIAGNTAASGLYVYDCEKL